MRSVHVYPSPFEYETRMLKITRSMVGATPIDEVVIIAQLSGHLPKLQRLDKAREVRRIGTRITGDRFWWKALRFVEWWFRVLFNLRYDNIDIVNCHSLSVLPLCVVLSTMHRAILVYEPHELETETVTFAGSRKRIAKLVERALIGFAKRIIVVSESIADIYQKDYGLARRPDVILNVPPIAASTPAHNNGLREYFGIPKNNLIFMYQGVLDETRGCGLLLEAFKNLPSSKSLVFLGFGPMEKEIATAAKLHPNIYLHPAVPPDQVLDYTMGADIGFALLEDTCLNHRCALPNKLFHYVHAGIPVVVSDLREMGAFVDEWGCGWRSANKVTALVERVASITPEKRKKAAKCALACRQALNWQGEETKLKIIYNELLGPEGQSVSA